MGFKRAKPLLWERVFQWTQNLEKLLLRLIVLALVLVGVGQVFSVPDPWEPVISQTEAMGESGVREQPKLNETGEWETASVTLELENYSSLARAVIKVNGHQVAGFKDKQITLKVGHGDLLEVDGSFYQRSFLVKVLDTSPEVATPKEGRQFLIRSGVVELGRVKLR